MAMVCVASSPGGSSSTPSVHRGEQDSPQKALLQTLENFLYQENYQTTSEDSRRAPDAGAFDSTNPDNDHDINCSDIDRLVPVIDLSAVRSGDDSGAIEQLVEIVASSCREWGCFQVINHGVPQEVLAAAHLQAESLFNLPLRRKIRCGWSSRGGPGCTMSSKVHPRETVNSWSESFLIHLRPESDGGKLAQRLDLEEAHKAEFGHAIREYSAELHSLGSDILDLIIRGLPGDMTEAHFKEVSGNNRYMEDMRMDLHLSCPQPELKLNLGSYTDPSILTILHQGNSSGGLEILRAGRWLAVEPLPHALCVQTGDMMEILTNGRYKSVRQRVVVDKKQERLSVAFIMSPRTDQVAVGPAPDLVLIEKQCCYQTVTWGHYRDEKDPTRGPVRYDYF